MKPWHHGDLWETGNLKKLGSCGWFQHSQLFCFHRVCLQCFSLPRYAQMWYYWKCIIIHLTSIITHYRSLWLACAFAISIHKSIASLILTLSPQMRKVRRVWPSFCCWRCVNWENSFETAVCVSGACLSAAGWRRTSAAVLNVKHRSYVTTDCSLRGLSDFSSQFSLFL